jgi:hypothetical protein
MMIVVLTTLLVADMQSCRFLGGSEATRMGGVVRYVFKSQKPLVPPESTGTCLVS